MEAEPKLRRQIEDVAALRRRLPKGGKIKENYVFEEGAADFSDRTTVKQTRFSELFHPGKNSLVVYSFMYAPDWEKSCPSCSSILDRLNGIAPHVTHSGRTLPSPPKRRFKACAIGRAEETGRISSCCPRGKAATTPTMALKPPNQDKYRFECLPKRAPLESITSTTRNFSMRPWSRDKTHGTWTLSGRCGTCSILPRRVGEPTGIRNTRTTDSRLLT